MQTIGAHQLIGLWERVHGLPPHLQAEEMLAGTSPDLSRGAVAALSIGARDACLLTLRERLFGPRFISLVDCPRCGERVELGFRADDIRAPADMSGTRSEKAGSLPLIADGWRVEYRVPTGADLAEIAQHADLEAARGELLARCVLAAVPEAGLVKRGADSGDGPAAGSNLERLPPALIDRVVEAMSAADPQAEVELQLCCPECGHQWQAAFDIVSFLIAEIGAWARRTLKDVALLARGYGWSESEILAMTSVRRRAYLDLLGSP